MTFQKSQGQQFRLKINRNVMETIEKNVLIFLTIYVHSSFR